MQGVGSAIFVPTVATLNAPTSVEMTAGTEYKNQISGLDGFAPSGSTVDFPNMGTRQTPNVPGLVTLGTGTVTFNLSRVIATTDARTVFNDGTDGSQPTTGCWYFTPNGIVTGAKMRGYRVTVTSAVPSMALDAVQTMAVEFAIQEATGFITVPTA
jgi:hypothetical protein